MTLLLLALLSQTPDQHVAPLVPTKIAQPNELPRTVEPRTPQTERWSENATRRFLGALAGGAVGIAVPAGVALAAAACDPRTTPSCSSIASVVGGLSAVVAPFMAAAGGALGFGLAGGEASVGVGFAAIIGGLGLGGALALLHLALIPGETPQAAAVIIPLAALAISFQALALEDRHEVLVERPEVGVPVGRFLLEVVGTVGALAGAALFALLVGGVALNPVVGVVAAVVFGALTPLVPWAIHRAKEGRGSLAAGYLGLLSSVGVAALAFGTVVLGTRFLDARGLTMTGTLLTAGSLVTAIGIPLLIEWSHGRAILEGERGPESDEDRRLSAGLAPVIGPTGLTGGGLSLSGTF